MCAKTGRIRMGCVRVGGWTRVVWMWPKRVDFIAGMGGAGVGYEIGISYKKGNGRGLVGSRLDRKAMGDGQCGAQRQGWPEEAEGEMSKSHSQPH